MTNAAAPRSRPSTAPGQTELIPALHAQTAVKRAVAIAEWPHRRLVCDLRPSEICAPRKVDMNGIHDMGGMHGFGTVEPEPNEPPFHSRWEGRALALNRAMSYAKVWNIDRSRAAIEEMPPHLYLTMSYYEKWALRLEKLLLEYGLVGPDEIAAGHSLRAAKPVERTLAATDVAKALTRGTYSRPATTEARFKVGDRVRT